jgi:hypothetical protein
MNSKIPVLAERLIIHEQVDRLATAIHALQPARELLGRERPTLPAAVAEAERDVVRELVALQEHR